MPSMRERCSDGPSQMPRTTPKPTEPMLKNVDAIAGTPKRLRRVQHAHRLRGQRHQQQEREHDARHA